MVVKGSKHEAEMGAAHGPIIKRHLLSWPKHGSTQPIFNQNAHHFRAWLLFNSKKVFVPHVHDAMPVQQKLSKIENVRHATLT